MHHWYLIPVVQASQATREQCLLLGQAALALAGPVGGVVTDMLGFGVRQPEDMLLH
jgi:hypothetical protein